MKISLRNVTLAFAQLDKAVSFNGGDPKFSVTLLLDKNDKVQVDAVNDAVMQALKGRFGDKAEKILSAIENNSQRYNISDGDTKEYDGFAGNMAIKCNSKFQPTMIDLAKNELKDANAPRSGDVCNVKIEIIAYDKPNSGVTARINGIVLIKRGGVNGGRPASIEELEDLSEGLDADDLG